MIIDCHVHLSRYGHEGQSFADIRTGLLADVATHEVDLAIVYPDSEPGTGVADLATTRELVRSQPRLRMLATVHVPSLGQAEIAQLAALCEAREVVGLKLYPGFEPFYPDEPRCQPLYALCAQHRLPVVFHSGETMAEPARERYNAPEEIAKVGARFPQLCVVIAHFSQPHLEACRDVLLANPNVHADLSGLAHPEVVEACGEGAIARVLGDVARRCPEKLLFGTDWPICDVAAHLRLVASLPVSEAAKALILAGNAQRVFALGRPEAKASG